MAFDSEAARLRNDHLPLPNPPGPISAPPTSPSRLPDRPHFPTRASTLGSTNDLSRNAFSAKQDAYAHPHSDDLNHSPSARHDHGPPSPYLPAPSPAFLSATRPATPNSPSHHSTRTPTSDYPPDRTRRNSTTSDASDSSGSTSPNKGGPLTSTSSATSANLSSSSVPHSISAATSNTNAIPQTMLSVWPCDAGCIRPCTRHRLPPQLFQVSGTCPPLHTPSLNIKSSLRIVVMSSPQSSSP